ncbi:MAG: transporter substrate-binding domain-containing protein [Verrucomicrobia bacterium]|nr:transporter substrate-binding domain-containing protein [Verrucomicrobiota bacterium]
MNARLSIILAAVLAWLVPGLGAAEAPIRIGVEPLAEQLSHVEPNGRPVGFAVDIARAVARDQGMETELVVKPWVELLDEFKAKRIDVLAAVGATPERADFLTYTAPHVDLATSVFVRPGFNVPATVDELGEAVFGTTRKSLGQEYITRRGWNKIRYYAKLHDALQALNDGECDVVLAIGIIARQRILDAKLTRIVETDLQLPDLHFELRMGVHPDNPALLYRLNDGLAHVRASGAYDQIYEKWIGALEPRRIRLRDIRPYLLGLGALTLAVAAALLWQRRLLQKLATQTDELRQRKEQLSLVLEGSDDGFWDWDLVTGRVERSERWASMLGYTPAEIDRSPDFPLKLIHPDDLAAFDEFRDRLEAGATDRFQTEYRMRAKSGEWRWILDRGKIVARAADGRALRMAGTHTDLTDRKRTEAALAESEAMLNRSARLLEQTQSVANIGGWEIDLRTDRVFWTAETHRIHETSPTDFQPTVENGVRFYAPESRPIIGAAVENAIRHGTPYDLELEIITARQRRIRVRTTARVERADSRIVKIYGSFRDITEERAAADEREKLRLKMLEAQKLESLGVLAGGIAHDFNNLLTVILANASFARDTGGGDDERLAHIESAARRAADLCRQMLAYAGRGSFLIERTDLGQLVQDTARLLQVSISKKARLVQSLAPNLPAVDADASQIRQVVMNLVINASEALGDLTGEIHLSTRLARPDLTRAGVAHSFDLPAGDCVCIEVADTGQGMSPATLARIFDPFFTTKFAGRGLGLAAVLGIVRAHHGAITVDSTLARGSVFRLYLPASARTASFLAPAEPPAPVRRAGGTVLIAEDEPVVLATADALLRHFGYKTVLAADGHEAVHQFRASPLAFSAVLLDLTMPGLDGAEVLRVMRAINPSVRVLIMSGYSEQDIFARLRGLGEVSVMRKPFTQETLLARLAAVIG